MSISEKHRSLDTAINQIVEHQRLGKNWQPDLLDLSCLEDIFSQLNEETFKKLGNQQRDVVLKIYENLHYNDISLQFEKKLIEKIQNLQKVVFDSLDSAPIDKTDLFQLDPVLQKWSSSNNQNEREAFSRIEVSYYEKTPLDLSGLKLKQLPLLLFIDPGLASVRIDISNNPIAVFPNDLTLSNCKNNTLSKQIINQIEQTKKNTARIIESSLPLNSDEIFSVIQEYLDEKEIQNLSLVNKAFDQMIENCLPLIFLNCLKKKEFLEYAKCVFQNPVNTNIYEALKDLPEEKIAVLKKKIPHLNINEGFKNLKVEEIEEACEILSQEPSPLFIKHFFLPIFSEVAEQRLCDLTAMKIAPRLLLILKNGLYNKISCLNLDKEKDEYYNSINRLQHITNIEDNLQSLNNKTDLQKRRINLKELFNENVPNTFLLDLSNLELNEIPKRFILRTELDLKNTKELKLKNNTFKRVPLEFILSLPNLKIVDLTGNPLDKTSIEEAKKALPVNLDLMF